MRKKYGDKFQEVHKLIVASEEKSTILIEQLDEKTKSGISQLNFEMTTADNRLHEEMKNQKSEVRLVKFTDPMCSSLMISPLKPKEL